MQRLTALVIGILFIAIGAFSQEARLLRYPNTSETQVSFIYGGDVYIAPISGGIAQRITTSEGLERYPRFSPDGSKLAFTAEYDGNNEIYTIDLKDNFLNPKRITYSFMESGVAERQGPDKLIMQWTSDGSKILYRSRHIGWNLAGQLFFVGQDGGLPEQLPVPRGGFATLSPDGKKIAYNRIFRQYRTWKRYSGGQADDIRIYDLTNGQSENISNTKFQDIIPIWAGDKIYYLSDRDFTMNLFCYDLTTKQTKKITEFTEFDVKFPSLGAKHIAFENGGYIYLMDLVSQNVQKLEIFITNDFAAVRPSPEKVSSRITSGDVSPNALRAVFSARGDIYTVPASKGKIENLTNESGVHNRSAVWSPDGKWIAYISDKSGTDEIYLMKPDGSDNMQLTSNGKFYRYSLLWSPDSKKILTYDNTRNLYYIDIATKKQTNVAKSQIWNISDFEWSPDSRWIAYVDYPESRFGQINIYSLETGKSIPVTSEMYSSYNPKFTPGGRFLLFVSDREFNPSMGNFEYNFQYSHMANVYGLTLQDTIMNPFAVFENDEESLDEEEKQKRSKKGDEVRVEINFNNIIDRVFKMPAPAGLYTNLVPTKNHRLYYIRNEKDKPKAMFYYDFAGKEEKEVGNVDGFSISNDEKSIFFRSGRDYYITKLTEKISTKEGKEGKLDLTQMEKVLDKRAEWKQVFNESWRHFRDFFYDPNMHGYDWEAIRKRYETLLPYVSHRNDLTYIIGEMIGELDAGHAYVSGGDQPKVSPVPIGLLGADYDFDSKSNAYKIKKIYKGMNWEDDIRSPLTEPGLNIAEGDYIIEIDGVKLDKFNTPSSQLLNKADKFVKVKIGKTANDPNARILDVKTVKSERTLRYYDWVETNRKKVDSATNGKIGYIHVPDMMPNNGLNWFVRYFYPQLGKEGLIIDDRFNGGGNVSPLIIERLRRELVIAKYARNMEKVLTNPDAVMTGPMVCIINEFSMSDGDLFPYQFKALGLGPVIGRRSWGGVIGIYGSLPLLDGSSVNRPEVSNFSADGKWVLEDVGMVPDLDVDNDPWQEFHGNDQQLNKAIEMVLELQKTDKKPKVPSVPPLPNKKEEFGK
ncbi:MAG: PD40 domain-containing protein [Candidatus Kapabacteria bacterium]|nr:PD40 domain-containing protein [Ignavibacteriota bacterium]MCW5883964.1 PD40 domain-containing protein [Candidatus Kapabacteria bacterium]